MSPGLPTVSLRIAELLADPYVFSVPPYQRPYSWTSKEAGQLLDDIIAASGVDGSETAEPDYFLGAILLLTSARETSFDPKGPVRNAEIVDGQQRLVTLAILSAALRDIDESEEMLREVAPLLRATGGLPEGRTSTFRVELRGRQQAFLESCVLSEGRAARCRTAIGSARRSGGSSRSACTSSPSSVSSTGRSGRR